MVLFCCFITVITIIRTFSAIMLRRSKLILISHHVASTSAATMLQYFGLMRRIQFKRESLRVDCLFSKMSNLGAEIVSEKSWRIIWWKLSETFMLLSKVYNMCLKTETIIKVSVKVPISHTTLNEWTTKKIYPLFHSKRSIIINHIFSINLWTC